MACPFYLITELAWANFNRLLDVARETYKENVSDIYMLKTNLSELHTLPLALVYQESGFVFSLKQIDLEGNLPAGFINPCLKKGKWQFSSMDLVRPSPLDLPSFKAVLQKKMNARMKDALDETLILSNKRGCSCSSPFTPYVRHQDYSGPRGRNRFGHWPTLQGF